MKLKNIQYKNIDKKKTQVNLRQLTKHMTQVMRLR